MGAMRHSFDFQPRPPVTANYRQFSVRTSPELLRRLRIACAEECLTYHELLTMLLDLRDTRLAKQRASMAHPLHHPAAGR